MTRTDFVKEFMSQITDRDIVIASTGYIAREVYRYDRKLNFYMQGSMGCALGIGIGLALNVKERVFVLNGDGASLMSWGTMVLLKSLELPNLFHFILDNGCHESTGGQPTCFRSSLETNKNTQIVNIDLDETEPPRIDIRPKIITKRFRNAIKALGYK